MGQQGRRLHRDDRRAIIRLRLSGTSIRRTAQRCGCCHMTVKRVAPPELLARLRRLMDGD